MSTEARLGLALSGGGYRASFFHIGVLARLAEFGLLRELHAISTVSGGSIVGALYYLWVKELLERKRNPTNADYAEIVRRIEEDFFVFASSPLQFRTRYLRAIVTPRISRTTATAKLLDEKLYQPVAERWHHRKAQRRPVQLRELPIVPAGWPENNNRIFHPLKEPGDAQETDWERDGDAIRKATLINSDETGKRFAPFLMINATCLNTGHAWRFDPYDMGEARPWRDRTRGPKLARSVDRNLRLAWGMPYGVMPKHLQEFTLGKAVAASAAVPSVFPPLEIPNMYALPEKGRSQKITVYLADGGLNDNLGIESLLHLGCNTLVVSDAAGRLTSLANNKTVIGENGTASSGKIAKWLRTTNVLMERIRHEQLYRLHEYQRNLEWACQSSSSESRKIAQKTPKNSDHYLPEVSLAWVDILRGCRSHTLLPLSFAKERQFEWQEDENFERVKEESGYWSSASGLPDRDVQELIGGLRTDLDRFTDVEAYALMVDGYLLSKGSLEKITSYLTSQDPKVQEFVWKRRDFADAASELLTQPSERFLEELRIGARNLFKPVRRSSLKGLTH